MQSIDESTRHVAIEPLAAPRPAPSRRGILAGALLASLTAVGARPVPAMARQGTPEAPAFETDIDVLNYALTLEHLEATFWENGLARFTGQEFLDIGFQTSVLDYLTAIRDHERAHVETLTQVINDLGGVPVEEVDYTFPYTTIQEFLSVGMALENTGVDAYTGAASFLIDNDELLTAALTIHGVEAEHAAYLNILNAVSPFPDAFDEPLPPAEVLEIVQPFIEGGA